MRYYQNGQFSDIAPIYSAFSQSPQISLQTRPNFFETSALTSEPQEASSFVNDSKKVLEKNLQTLSFKGAALSSAGINALIEVYNLLKSSLLFLSQILWGIAKFHLAGPLTPSFCSIDAFKSAQ